ncbi:Ada metal-binding domain-containing protein [bacterium]|nr:Ada metal-binding domain-containing protein [bacterium]
MKRNLMKVFVLAAMLFSFTCVFAAEIHCNPDTKTCHKSDCRYYNCKGCTKVFASEEEALENGYKFCQVCSKEKKESPKKSKK